ncbi:MAG TPA: N-formylglutamate amidohydrolase [Gammaproteobacteria bacterium]|nr:N-formylglutamate amidohydrolase [Gammaproteobacteria bacterium]
MKISSFHVREASNQEIPVVVSIPHCGIYVPEAIREKFASGYIRSLPLTDWYLHHLCDFLPGMGITTIYGTYSRFVADIDAPAEGSNPRTIDTSFVPLKTPNGDDVYTEPPTPHDIQMRRDLVYAPYHARLSELLQSRITRFGNVALVDVHSFPSHIFQEQQLLSRQIYLGDDGGRANPGWLTGAAQHAFTHAGLSVSRNGPFRDGYIVGHYGGLPRVSALHVGARWDLYLDEQHPDRTPSHAGFRAFKSVLSDVFTRLVSEINAGAMRMNSRERLGARRLTI